MHVDKTSAAATVASDAQSRSHDEAVLVDKTPHEHGNPAKKIKAKRKNDDDMSEYLMHPLICRFLTAPDSYLTVRDLGRLLLCTSKKLLAAAANEELSSSSLAILLQSENVWKILCMASLSFPSNLPTEQLSYNEWFRAIVLQDRFAPRQKYSPSDYMLHVEMRRKSNGAVLISQVIPGMDFAEYFASGDAKVKIQGDPVEITIAGFEEDETGAFSEPMIRSEEFTLKGQLICLPDKAILDLFVFETYVFFCGIYYWKGQRQLHYEWDLGPYCESDNSRSHPDWEHGSYSVVVLTLCDQSTSPVAPLQLQDEEARASTGRLLVDGFHMFERILEPGRIQEFHGTDFGYYLEGIGEWEAF